MAFIDWLQDNSYSLQNVGAGIITSLARRNLGAGAQYFIPGAGFIAMNAVLPQAEYEDWEDDWEPWPSGQGFNAREWGRYSEVGGY